MMFIVRPKVMFGVWPRAGEARLPNRREAGCGTLVPTDVGEGAMREERIS